MSSVKIVQPSGMLDGIKANQLRSEISNIVSNGVDIVLIDLEDVKFIDSSGLGALVSAMKMVKTAGGKLFICSLNEQVKIIFELTRMDRIFEHFADRDEFNRQVLAVE